MTRILVVDDERPLLHALGIHLQARGYEVDTVETGESALARVATRPYDAAIVDLGLPGIDGIEVVQGLRGWTSIPIIVLSARHQDNQKIAALDAGADDYVTKPFSMGELLARLRAALRRVRPAEDLAAPVVETDDFRIDLVNKARDRCRRNRGQAHAHPMAPRRDPRAPSGASREPTAVAGRGVGCELHEPDELLAPVHGASATQARAGPDADRATS